MGSIVIPDGVDSSFTLSETGLYRVEFILQGGLNNAAGAQVQVNGVSVGPMFHVSGFTSVNNQIVGVVVIQAFAGDVVQIALVTPNGSNIQNGSSLLITRLSS